MATIDVNSAIQSISQNRWSSPYILLGEERYFFEKCLQHFRYSSVPAELRDFNEEIFYGTDLEVEKLIDSLQMLPVMAERRLVVLKEAQHLNEKQWLQLESIGNLSSDMIFVIQADQLDRRKKTIKKWLELSTIVDCSSPPDSSRGPWIRSLANEKGLELDQEALSYLVQTGGNNLEALDQELERIQLFFGSGKKIKIADIAQVLDRAREENIFSLSEAVGKKDRTQSLFLYSRLRAQGENEIALVSIIARHLRILLKIKVAQDKLNMKGSALAQYVGVNNYYLPNYVQQSLRWTQSELMKALEHLSHLDSQFKTTSLAPAIWMDSFLLFQ